MKFTTYFPIKRNDGTPFDEDWLKRVVLRFWTPFRGMTNEGMVEGFWTADDGTVYHDFSMKISIECDRGRLQEAIRAVRRVGRKLEQLKMWFEVSGYDGVQYVIIS